MSMNDKPNKGKFVPKAGGKKKKKKKRRNKSNNEPEHDPHFRESVLTQQQRRPKPKHKRRTKFEADMEAPTIQIISGNTFSCGYGGGRNSNRGKGDNNSNISGKNRRPRGTRTVVRSSGGSNQIRKIYTNLEKAEQTARTRVYSPQVLEDKSGDEEEEKKELMDIDNEENNNENNDYDPWHNESEDIKYTPITLKTKPKFGKNGIFLQTEMLNVFDETQEYGNEFMLMQMPPVLPLISHLNEDEKRDLANNKNVEQSLLRQMGEGKIGKIRIRKSGKTELVIGDFVMDVNFASPMDCYQQVMHVHCENTSDRQIKGKSQFLGDVPPQNNLVCSYRAEDLLL